MSNVCCSVLQSADSANVNSGRRPVAGLAVAEPACCLLRHAALAYGMRSCPCVGHRSGKCILHTLHTCIKQML